MLKSLSGTCTKACAPDPACVHALELLVRHKRSALDNRIHLDIGCGHGRLAEPVRAAFGVDYVGCDSDAAALDSLRQRGFETHRLQFGDAEQTFVALKSIIAGRRLASISVLDGLARIPDTAAFLRVLHRLAQPDGANVVVGVPNVTHFDIGAKLILGRLDVTADGILNHANARIFSAATLDRELRAAGLHPIDSHDLKRAASDQHFPNDHPLLSQATGLGSLLRALRRNVDAEHEEVYQLIRLCSPGSAAAVAPFVTAAEEERPFITAVVRTQGRRMHTLRETLLCLGAQTDQDVEVLVIGHKLEPAAVEAIERVIEDQPEYMRSRTRFVRVEEGNRVRPLNIGFAEARGRYIAIVDDDDIPMAHWIETFRKLDRRAPGRLLRTACVRQNVRSVTVCGNEGLRDEGPPERVYSKTFDMIDHLWANQSPPITLAFPRGVFHDLGVRFDESMTTTEDWDYMMRVAMLVGVESSPERTGVYRWWTHGESSRTEHEEAEWQRNYYAVLRKLDAAMLLLPAGSVDGLRRGAKLHAENRELREEKARLEAKVEGLHEDLSTIQETIRASTTLRLVAAIPGPLRSIGRSTIRGTYWLFRGRFFGGARIPRD